MINFKNEGAAAEARRLSRELIDTAIGAFASLPAGVELRRLLAGVNIELRGATGDVGRFRLNWPHETAEISFVAPETAGSEHAAAITELTRIRTAELADDHTADAVAEARTALRNELATERERLSRPLRFGRLLRGAENRRQAQRDALIERALDTLNGVPLSGPLFDEVLDSALKNAGSTSAAWVDTESLKRHAMSLHNDFQTQRERILMLAWEAIVAEDGGANVDMSPTVRRSRFARAKARARANEEKARQARIQAEEQKRNEAARTKRAEIARERERRRKWDEMTRPRWSPSDPEPDDDYEFGG